jgi:ribosomal protein L18
MATATRAKARASAGGSVYAAPSPEALGSARPLALRAISGVGFAPLAALPRAFGPEPELRWVAIADLVVDESYQRNIDRRGVSHVRAIAENFSWAKFGAVICAPAHGAKDKFAIIDGQHRATAAALLGIAYVPAQVIALTRGEQAVAFSAINIAVKRLHTLHAHAAAVSAGDPDAVAIDAVVREAGVSISRYPQERDQMELGETGCVGALKRALRRHGREILLAALRCLTRPKHNRQGAVNALSLRAMLTALAQHPALPGHPGLLAAMDTIDARALRDWMASCANAPEASGVGFEIARELMAALKLKEGK